MEEHTLAAGQQLVSGHVEGTGLIVNERRIHPDRPPLGALVQRQVMRTLFRLPDPVKRRIAGNPVVLDGNELALDAQLLAEISRRGGVSLVVNDDVEQSRAALADGRHAVKTPDLAAVATRDLLIPAEHDNLWATLYEPLSAPAPSPLLVFFHGGGWVIGDLTIYDSLMQFLTAQTGVRILAVAYRKAPENPYPAAIEDAVTALRYAHDHARALGADSDRIAVGGDSAGANLAAVVAQRAARTPQDLPPPAHQFLFYPATDFTRRHPSRDTFADGYMLTDHEIAWFHEQYAAQADRADPGLSPLLGELTLEIAPADIFTAGFDPLRDEGEAYAHALKHVGGQAVLHREATLLHGYLVFFAFGGPFRAAAQRAATVIAGRLGRQFPTSMRAG